MQRPPTTTGKDIMTNPVSLRLAIVLSIALLLTGAGAQADPGIQISSPTLTPTIQVYEKPTVVEQTPPAGTAASCAHELIYSVDAAHIEWSSGTMTLKAYGTVRTGGWSEGALRPHAGNNGERTLTYRFEACPPGGFSTQALDSIEASRTLTIGVHDADYIVVISERDSVTLDMSRYR